MPWNLRPRSFGECTSVQMSLLAAMHLLWARPAMTKMLHAGCCMLQQADSAVMSLACQTFVRSTLLSSLQGLCLLRLCLSHSTSRFAVSATLMPQGSGVCEGALLKGFLFAIHGRYGSKLVRLKHIDAPQSVEELAPAATPGSGALDSQSMGWVGQHTASRPTAVSRRHSVRHC